VGDIKVTDKSHHPLIPPLHGRELDFVYLSVESAPSTGTIYLSKFELVDEHFSYEFWNCDDVLRLSKVNLHCRSVDGVVILVKLMT
jgi:hypothetical protein